MTSDWSTPEALNAHRDTIAASIEGYEPPAAFAVGISSATSAADTEFPHVNAGTGLLPAVVMAKTVRHVSGTATYPLTLHELQHALTALSPAEACTSMPHPNLAAWRQVVADLEANPARTAVAVFVGDLGDPVSSEADGSLRLLLP